MCNNMGPAGWLSWWRPARAGVGCGPWVLWLIDYECSCVLQLRLFVAVANHGCVCGLSVVVSVGCALRLRAWGVAGVAFPAFFSRPYIMTVYSLRHLWKPPEFVLYIIVKLIS